MENQPTPNDPQIDFDLHIHTDRWSKITTIEKTELLAIAEEARQLLSEDLHRSTVSDILKRMRNGRVAKTSHAQLTAIFNKSIMSMLKTLSEKKATTLEEFESFERRINSAIRQAQAIDAECHRRAEEEKRLSSQGNIRFVTVKRKKKAS